MKEENFFFFLNNFPVFAVLKNIKKMIERKRTDSFATWQACLYGVVKSS
jgi:hypothetical protein